MQATSAGSAGGFRISEELHVYSPLGSNNRTVNNGLLFYLHDEALNYKHHY